MAVFLINICKFNGCGIKFDSLGELITHIENIHIGKCDDHPNEINWSIFVADGYVLYARTTIILTEIQSIFFLTISNTFAVCGMFGMCYV